MLRLLAMRALWLLLPAAALDPLRRYSFQADSGLEVAFTAPQSAVVLGGRSTTECGTLSFTENVAGLAIAITDKGQNCFTSDQYSVGDFPVVVGHVTIQGQETTAYELRPPQSQAQQFVASGSRLYLELPGDGAEYSIYRLQDGEMILLVTVQAGSTPQFVAVAAVEGITSPQIYAALPSSRLVPSPARLVVSGYQATECANVFPQSGVISDITLVTMQGSSNSCWTDARYSNSDYLVEKGQLQGSGDMAALRVSPPNNRATQFVASRTQLYIRKPTSDMKIWTYRAGQFELLDTVSASATTDFAKTEVRVDNLEEALILVISLASKQLSVWPQVSATVQAASLGGVSRRWSLSCRRFQVDGQPFVPSLHWNDGPQTHSGNYGDYKRFFPVLHGQREGVVWQDFTNEVVKVTWFATDLLSSETQQLVTLSSQLFLGAVGDGQGDLVLLLGQSQAPASKDGTVQAEAVKFSGGSEVLRKSLATQKDELDIYSFSRSGVSLAWDPGAGTIACAIARTMTMAGDGLNHQGGIAMVLNATTLEMITNYGQTSGHSFANSIQVSSKEGFFLGMDLGDNYPRGVNLWELRGDYRLWRKKLVYSFKTKHGTRATSPAGATYPEYTAISTPQQTYYQWSNDNYVYTELAHPGIHELDDAVLVFFSGEQPPLDNSVTGSAMNVARNVAWVKIPRDFSNNSVLSPGEEETGGFYTFGGRWSDQVNRGISFLTSYTEKSESVSRPKTAGLAEHGVLLLWEIWGTSYNRSELMLVDSAGRVVEPLTSLSFPMELPFADDLVVRNGKVVAYVGVESSVARFEICLGEQCEAATEVQGTSPPESTTATASGEATSSCIRWSLAAVAGHVASYLL